MTVLLNYDVTEVQMYIIGFIVPFLKFLQGKVCFLKSPGFASYHKIVNSLESDPGTVFSFICSSLHT